MSKQKKTVEELLEEISGKIDKLITILVIQGKDIDVQIKALKQLGYESSEIGIFVGMKSDAVRKRLSRMKNE